ncbi:MAG: inositol monophosphatase [Anaerolineales bacterium]|nr:MAG: inositol monophosphatase [Anaerolineales bacterium]
MKPYDNWLQSAIAAAKQGGRVIKQAWQGPHAVHFKSPRNIVTETDIQVEDIVLSSLQKAFPDHAFTSEEAGADAVNAPVRWFVDPLDGTTNFSRDNPNFCISLAAAENGQPVVGVIFDPLRDHMFAATYRGGASLNGKALHVSDVTEVYKAVISFDIPRLPEARQKIMDTMQKLVKHIRTVRGLGSAALNMAYIAAGWTDGYLALNMSPWDQMAAALLITEAGGVVATLSGQAWDVESRDPLMAASPELEIALRSILRDGDL